MPSCFLFSLYQPCSHHHFLRVGPVVTPSSPTTPPPPTCLLRCHSRYFCLCPYVSLSLSIALYVAMLYLSCMSMLCVQRYPPHLFIKVSIFLYIAYLFHHKLCKKSPLIVPLIFSLQKVPIFIASGHPCIYTNMPFLDFLGLYLK